MSLIKCNECRKEISDKAVACIHCGAVLDKPKRICLECGKEITDDKCMNCGYINNPNSIESENVNNIKINRDSYNSNKNFSSVLPFILAGIVIAVVGYFITNNSTGNNKNSGMPLGCYRATNRNGGLSDYKLCIENNSVIYDYLLLDNSYNSIEKRENLYPEWISSSNTIIMRDRYDDLWFRCSIDKEDSNSMKCIGMGKGGFGISSSSIWKKQ